MIDPQAIPLIKFDGFNKMFESYMGICTTQEKAYEMVESIHERAFGHRKYSDFNSFRVVRFRKIKKMLSKK